MADNTEKDEPQDVSDFLGVDPIYMNYSDERNKPFRAELDEDANDGEGNQADVDTEDVAYSHQEWTREDALQDPATGEPLDVNQADILKAKREQYKDPNWGPNVPHAMTGKDTSTESQSSTTSNTGSTNTVESTGETTADTGSNDSVKADGGTGDSDKASDGGASTPAPTAPAAPKAATKTASSSTKK